MKGYRTVLFNAVAAIIPVLEVSGHQLGLEGSGLAWYTVAITVINLGLRAITHTPIGKSE